MRILAFMQNAWFPEGTEERHKELYNTDQEFHRRLLRRTMSGNRLYQAFGEMFDQIYWDNVSPVAASEARGLTEPNMEWVDRVIREQDPELILTFGNVASDTISRSLMALRIKVMECHHPNARHKTQDDLNQFALCVRNYVQFYAQAAQRSFFEE